MIALGSHPTCCCITANKQMRCLQKVSSSGGGSRGHREDPGSLPAAGPREREVPARSGSPWKESLTAVLRWPWRHPRTTVLILLSSLCFFWPACVWNQFVSALPPLRSRRCAHHASSPPPTPPRDPEMTIMCDGRSPRAEQS